MELKITKEEGIILMCILLQKANHYHVRITECMGDDNTANTDTYVVKHARVNQLMGKIKALSCLAD